ncbi:MAG: hypothetical protein ACR2M6_03365 [Vampirovibrionia bacterium]
MDSKLEQLVASVTELISKFLITEVGEYKENYEYMLNSPMCRKLLSEITDLKAENQALKESSTKPNIQLEISEDDSDNYQFDRKYRTNSETKKLIVGANIDDVYNEETEEESGNEVTDNEESGGEESPPEEEVEESGGEGSPPEEEVEESEGEVTDGEEVEVTDGEEVDESGGEGSPLEDDEESGDEEEVEEVEVTDESGGEGSPLEEVEESGGEGSSLEEEEEEEEDEEEEVFEYEYKGKMYFATDEVNGTLYSCVDDDIGDEVGKIENKNVILF